MTVIGSIFLGIAVARAGMQILGGSLADRFNRRQILLISGIGRVLSFALLALAILGDFPFYVIFISILLAYGFGSMFMPAASAMISDIVLPGASFMEVTDLYKAYGHNYIQMAEPVIPPVGESRSTLSIFQDLAARLGFKDDDFSLKEMDFIVGFLVEASPYLKGIDLETLKSGRAMRLNIPSNPYADGFSTPSGKVEFYSQAMADQGLDPLPDGQPIRDPDGGDNYRLEFITPPNHFFLNSAFNEIDELREKAGEARVMIHPNTARARGITDGDLVSVFNHRGECRFRAQVTDDTQVGLLVAEGLHWPSLSPGGGANQLTSQRLTDMGETCAFHCSLVEVQPRSY